MPIGDTQKETGVQLLRFVLVGVLNTGFGYLVYLVLLFGGLAPAAALAAATALGALFNYVTTGRLVFAEQGFQKLPAFLVAYVVIYLGNLVLLKAIISAGLSPALAQMIALPLVAATSFLIFKVIVFRPVR